MPVNNPTDHGWKEEDSKLLPVWTTLPFAKDVFQLGCEMHLYKYLYKSTYQFSVQVHEGKVKVHTSVQVYVRNSQTKVTSKTDME